MKKENKKKEKSEEKEKKKDNNLAKPDNIAAAENIHLSIPIFNVKKITNEGQIILTDDTIAEIYEIQEKKDDQKELERWLNELEYPVQIVKKRFNIDVDNYITEKIEAAKTLIFNKKNDPNNILYEEYDELLFEFEEWLKDQTKEFKPLTRTFLVINVYAEQEAIFPTNKNHNEQIKKTAKYLEEVKKNTVEKIKRKRALKKEEIKGLLESYLEYRFISEENSELTFKSFEDLLNKFKNKSSKTI